MFVLKNKLMPDPLGRDKISKVKVLKISKANNIDTMTNLRERIVRKSTEINKIKVEEMLTNKGEMKIKTIIIIIITETTITDKVLLEEVK